MVVQYFLTGHLFLKCFLGISFQKKRHKRNSFIALRETSTAQLEETAKWQKKIWRKPFLKDFIVLSFYKLCIWSYYCMPPRTLFLWSLFSQKIYKADTSLPSLPLLEVKKHHKPFLRSKRNFFKKVNASMWWCII